MCADLNREHKIKMNKSIIIDLAAELQSTTIGRVILAGSGAMLFYHDGTETTLRNTDIDLIVLSENFESYRNVVTQVLDIDGVFPSTTYHNQLVCVEYKGVNVDIIPSKPEILGYTNTWFKLAFELNPFLELNSNVSVINSGLFVATKLEAALDQLSDDIFHTKHLADVLFTLDHVQISFDIDHPQSKSIYEYLGTGLESLGINPKKYLRSFTDDET